MQIHHGLTEPPTVERPMVPVIREVYADGNGLISWEDVEHLAPAQPGDRLPREWIERVERVMAESRGER